MELPPEPHAQPRPDQKLGRQRRLTATRDFQETYAQGRSWRGRVMVLWLRSGEGVALRLGVVASRKVGGAVQRARAKRRLRSVYRLHRDRLQGPYDVVLIARYGMPYAPWRIVVEDLLQLARKAGILAAPQKESERNA